MSFLNRLICLVKGHKTSLFPGIGAPAAFQWTYPGQGPAPVPVIVPAPATMPVQPNTFIGIMRSTSSNTVSNTGIGIMSNTGISGPSRGGTGIHARGGAGHGIVAHTGPSYNLDLCPRCFELYVRPPPPICKNCQKEQGLHKNEVCDLPCQNCRRPLDAHVDGKCLFEASDYKGASYEAILGT